MKGSINMNFETLKRNHLKRSIIIGVIAILVISAIILNFTRAKYKVTQSIPLVNGTINYSLADFNTVAIYIEGDNGYEKTDTMPESGYEFNDEESYCTVNNERDDSISLSYDVDTKTLTLTPITTKGTKCYLYFDSVKGAADIIASLVNTSNEVVTDDFGNARFIGKNPNNYVYFNCDDYNNPSSSTCELWRIIGVFSEDTHGISNTKLVKLINTHGISNTKLVKLIKSDSIGDIEWNSGYTNDWSNASLQKSLNGSYLNGSTFGNGKGITSQTNSMIETVTWKLGDNSTYNNITTIIFYERERGTTVYSGNPTTWKGKIALIYPSDYGYATNGGSATNRASCLAKELYNWASTSDCYNNDWLYNSSYYQWTLTTQSSSNVFLITNTGFIDINFPGLVRGVRPSLYLKSDIAITGGNGTSTNPYVIS